jgi:hypothetical protein
MLTCPSDLTRAQVKYGEIVTKRPALEIRGRIGFRWNGRRVNVRPERRGTAMKTKKEGGLGGKRTGGKKTGKKR